MALPSPVCRGFRMTRQTRQREDGETETGDSDRSRMTRPLADKSMKINNDVEGRVLGRREERRMMLQREALLFSIQKKKKTHKKSNACLLNPQWGQKACCMEGVVDTLKPCCSC